MKPPMLKQASWLLSPKAKPKSPLLTPEKAIELLGTMQGGYNIHPLIDALDDAKTGTDRC
ncbi:bifunctional aconitate hydratase 2/2-methylisocitrate dehydratase [Escherichia coli]|nr:bifunctional aconitate hydratase 2/2-methylisocitrate dehydratase [Escherichia coli]